MLSMMVMAAAMAGSNPLPAIARVSEGAGTITAAPAVKKPKQYCVKVVITGSRMARTKCQTRAEWLNAGFDPTAPN